MFLEAAAGMEGSTPTSRGHLLCVLAPLAYLKSRVGKEASPTPGHDQCVPDTYCSVSSSAVQHLHGILWTDEALCSRGMGLKWQRKAARGHCFERLQGGFFS